MIPQFKVYMSPLASDYVEEVLNSGYIGQGKKVEEFEEELRSFLGFRYGVTVNSGTSALWLALHLAGVGKGDTVISTPMTCSATNSTISLMGADILWADVDEYGNISPESVGKRVSSANKVGMEIKAIMAVDWGGLPCDYDAIRYYAGDIPIIQDAAHSFGATYKGLPITQTAGDYIAFSFQAIKHLTTGDGGLLVVPPEQYERAKLLRWYGLDREKESQMRCRQDIIEAGYKFHMNDINASIGLANIKSAKWVLERNRYIAKYYDTEFEGTEIVPKWPKDRESSFWLYTIHVPRPKSFEIYAKEHGFGASQTHHRNDMFSFLKEYKRSDLHNLDSWFNTMVCIPCGWWIKDYEVEHIADTVKEWVANNDLSKPMFPTKEDYSNFPGI
jgi:dTDP-4-amino-4,6-dideoxygalactose transaminase